MNPHPLMALLLGATVLCACEPDPDPPLSIAAPDNDMTSPTPDMADEPDAPDTSDLPDMGGRPDVADRPDMRALPDMAGSCDGVDCGRGDCRQLGTETVCECDDGFTGDNCDECLEGYAGPECDMCAEGFMPDPLAPAICTPDPCAGDPCNGNGACLASQDPTGVMTTCRCDTGFTGAECDACDTGYTGADCDVCDTGFTLENGSCVILACSPFPCGDHGLCSDADGDGTSECNCDTGWTGRDCGTCAPGYALDTATGECVVDVCLNVPCDHGTCLPAPTGGPIGICACETGYEGAACDTCAFGYSEVTVGTQTLCQNVLPVRDSRITGWYDAWAPSTVDVNQGGFVWRWSNRMQPNSMRGGNFDASKPRYVLIPKPGVVFDGDDVLWTGTPLFGTTDSYSMFVVATWDLAKSENTLVDSYYGSYVGLPQLPGLPYRLQARGDRAIFSHGQGLNNTTAADTVELGGFSPSGPQVVIAQRGPFLNGRAMRLRDGDGAEATAPSTAPDLVDQTVVTTLGAIQGLLFAVDPNEVYADEGLEGVLHEVIFVKGTLTVQEQDAISAYLRVRWGVQ